MDWTIKGEVGEVGEFRDERCEVEWFRGADAGEVDGGETGEESGEMMPLFTGWKGLGEGAMMVTFEMEGEEVGQVFECKERDGGRGRVREGKGEVGEDRGARDGFQTGA